MFCKCLHMAVLQFSGAPCTQNFNHLGPISLPQICLLLSNLFALQNSQRDLCACAASECSPFPCSPVWLQYPSYFWNFPAKAPRDPGSLQSFARPMFLPQQHSGCMLLSCPVSSLFLDHSTSWFLFYFFEHSFSISLQSPLFNQPLKIWSSSDTSLSTINICWYHIISRPQTGKCDY